MAGNFFTSTWFSFRIAIAVVVIAAIVASTGLWWPVVSRWVDSVLEARRPGAPSQHAAAEHNHAHGNDSGHASFASHGAGRVHEHGGDRGSGHDHSSGHAAAHSIELTPQARANLGLSAANLRPIELTTYQRSISLPAIVVPRPGRSQIIVSSPLSGIVSHVHAVPGEAVLPGQLLFEVRLTYEDLVETQSQYLRTLSELEVENREIQRLESATQSGALSGKALLERRYAKDKLEALLRSQREALRLHGLSEKQVEEIGTQGRLLGDLQIVAPDIDRHGEHEELRLTRSRYMPISYQEPAEPMHAGQPMQASPRLLVIDDLQVHKGQSVAAGDRLCSLSDLSQLYIEGKAFEQDAATISAVATNGWKVTAVLPDTNGSHTVEDLSVAFIGNSIDPVSHSLSVYVELPNVVLSDQTNGDGQRFVNWKYRVGQRLELQIPVEQWPKQIVLPVSAIVKDGADWFVFQQNGESFDRVPVHVKYRDQASAVIANDGSIFPGDVVARTAAHQLQMALKNQAGGPVDPHAGHTH